MSLKTEFSTTTSSHRKATVFNGSAPGANTGITGGITFSGSAGAARITIALTTSSVVNVSCTDGSTTHKWGLNASSALNAGDVYTFSLGVSATDDGTSTGTALTYDIEVETDSVIEILIIDEIKGGVI